MEPNNIPEDLLAIFNFPGEEDEKVETNPAPVDNQPKFHNESLAYSFTTTDREMEENFSTSEPEFFNEPRCWDNAWHETTESTPIYDTLTNPEKWPDPVVTYPEFDFKELS